MGPDALIQFARLTMESRHSGIRWEHAVRTLCDKLILFLQGKRLNQLSDLDKRALRAAVIELNKADKPRISPAMAKQVRKTKAKYYNWRKHGSTDWFAERENP